MYDAGPCVGSRLLSKWQMEQRKLFYKVCRGDQFERRKYLRAEYTTKEDVETLLQSHQPVKEFGKYSLGLEDANGD